MLQPAWLFQRRAPVGWIQCCPWPNVANNSAKYSQPDLVQAIHDAPHLLPHDEFLRKYSCCSLQPIRNVLNCSLFCSTRLCCLKSSFPLCYLCRHRLRRQTACFPFVQKVKNITVVRMDDQGQEYISMMNADAFPTLPATRRLPSLLSPQPCYRLDGLKSSSSVQ